MDQSLIGQGLELLVFGMGTVFVFLTALIFATNGMTAVVSRFAKPEPAPVAARRKPAAQPAAVDPTVVAAIQAALDQHRARHK